MRVSIAMKSNFAFERLKTTFEKKEAYQRFETYSKNIQSTEGVNDIIEFWEPELFILDSKLPDIASMSTTIESHDLPIIYFESDFDSVLEQVESFINGENEKANEEDERKTIEYVVDDRPKEVVYKDRIIEKEVIKTSYTSIPNKLIVMGSLWQGAGATTLAMNLARAIAERGLRVSYVEYPTLKPYMFDFLSIPMKEDEYKTKYIDFAQEISTKGRIKKRDTYWNDLGVNWYVLDSRNEPISHFSYDEILKFVYSVNSTITIVDVSSKLGDKEVQSFLHHADNIFICIEPDPVKIDKLSVIEKKGDRAEVQHEERQILDYLNQIEDTEGISYHFVNNKLSKNIDRKSWLECLEVGEINPITSIPSISYDHLIDCVWKSEVLYDSAEYKDILEKVLKPIIVKILPREFYELERESSSSKSKILNIFKRGVAK